MKGPPSNFVFPTLYSLLESRTYPEEPVSVEFCTLYEEQDYKCFIAPAITITLETLVEIGTKIPKRMKTPFDAKVVPEISIEDYLNRVIKYSPCSQECFLASTIYIDRLIGSGFVVTALNIHRLLITSILVASKLLDDSICNNKFFSHVAGIPVEELNRLELQFLKLINHRLYITADVYDLYRTQWEHCAAARMAYLAARAVKTQWSPALPRRQTRDAFFRIRRCKSLIATAEPSSYRRELRRKRSSSVSHSILEAT